MADEAADTKKWTGAPRKREVDDDFVVDDEDDGERPKKKAAGAAHSPSVTASGDTVICEFGGRKKVTVNTYQGRVNIHIREVRTQRPRKKSFGLGQYYEKDGKELPGKKGIALTPEQWETLMKHAGAVTAEINKRAGGGAKA